MIAATNRIDILDPALLRSGRLDRKIEFPLPKEEARARIMEIHSRKMNVSPNVNFEELAASTEFVFIFLFRFQIVSLDESDVCSVSFSEFNGAQLKAVCVEAGSF